MPWKEIWESHRGRITGIAGGLFFGIVYLMFGFWDMLFFALVVFIGYTLGRRSDERLPLVFPWRNWMGYLSERWRPFK
ncbi:DUF2273 domain-containing protein [Paenibacillus gallinarum]|uniref:DUF2273 domain-containing protein n=1 Tax=Paenibacillus gallinarum TaxID=2762232 RepID=A0ABR8SWQ7_9BACL|nr:DUF2273 domain-containing protein [Paenibacillus gallinarum]MBD7967945.1 DUF2273 domain-containing protein [Paenibacillus gallinarum]